MDVQINSRYANSELTGKIIGCAMEVHHQMGNGFQEVVYQRALSIELNLQKLNHIREMEMPLTYKGVPVHPSRIRLYLSI
jgi:GxxExxY protein